MAASLRNHVKGKVKEIVQGPRCVKWRSRPPQVTRPNIEFSWAAFMQYASCVYRYRCDWRPHVSNGRALSGLPRSLEFGGFLACHET